MFFVVKLYRLLNLKHMQFPNQLSERKHNLAINFFDGEICRTFDTCAYFFFF